VDRIVVRCLAVVSLIVVLWGCKAYEPRPLDPAEVVGSVDRARNDPSETASNGQPGVTLAQAAQWMRRHGPDVREAVAAYRTALARARIKTPLPNPGLEVGPEYGFGSDVTSNRLAPFGSLGFTIPLGGRLGRTDDLNRARAEVLRIEGVARHRELYLELRRRYATLAIAREIKKSRDELLEAAGQSVNSARRLVEAGQATALDVALFELERGKSQAETLSASSTAAEAQANLAALVGVHGDHFANLLEDALPALPATLPGQDELKEHLIANHTTLARLRARYEASERSLHLEIAKQYPDLTFGASAAGETGESKTLLGLSIGIELPLFDRNQQGIAEAEMRREEVRIQYESAANRALAELERASRSAELASERHRVLSEIVLPQARNSIDLARRSLSAGSGDALRLLDAERSYRQVLIEVLGARLAKHEAWVALEMAVGKPLIKFPSEADEGPQPVPGLEKEEGEAR